MWNFELLAELLVWNPIVKSLLLNVAYYNESIRCGVWAWHDTMWAGAWHRDVTTWLWHIFKSNHHHTSWPQTVSMIVLISSIILTRAINWSRTQMVIINKIFLMFGSLKHNHQKVFVYQHFVLVLLTVWLMIVGWLFKEQQLILLIVLHYVIVIINLSGSQPTE